MWDKQIQSNEVGYHQRDSNVAAALLCALTSHWTLTGDHNPPSEVQKVSKEEVNHHHVVY